MNRRIEAIKVELNIATTLFSEVDVLLKLNFYGTAIHTMYYSCFHLTRALLLTKDLVTKIHKGIATLLYEQFVKPGLFDNKKAAFFNELMHKRIESDYEKPLRARQKPNHFMNQRRSTFSM